jgi:hypothetical protein
MRMQRSSRLGALAGIAGPAAFTCAWAVASLRQPGHSAADVQLSGLAAMDARDPGIMIAGFAVLGACSVAFGGTLHEALGGSARAGPAPRLIQAVGLLTIAAGLLRRDHMLLDPPGVGAAVRAGTGAATRAAALSGDSWHNQAHDAVSSVIYVTLVVAPLLLAVRFRADTDWRRLTGPLLAGSAATGGILALFASDALTSWDPLLQRIAVTIPLATLAAAAGRLITSRRVR